MADRPPDLETELRDTLQARGGRRIRADELWADVQHRIRRHRRRRRLLTGFAALAVLALAAGATALVVRDDDPASTVDTGPGESLSTTTTAEPLAATTTTTTEATPDDPSDLNPGWTALGPGPVVPGREGHSATWTGTELILWGGTTDRGHTYLVEGHALDLETGAWRTLTPPVDRTPSDPLVQTPRTGHVAAWTGTELLLWGGRTSSPDEPFAYAVDGAAYDPRTDAWRPIPAAPLPADRYDGVWTGTELVVVGGGEATLHAAAYDPATGRWRELPEPPLAIVAPRVLWDGTQVITVGGIRGGDGPDLEQFRAQAFDPATDRWSDLGGQSVADDRVDAALGGEFLFVVSMGAGDGTFARHPTDGWARLPVAGATACEDRMVDEPIATRRGPIVSLCGVPTLLDVQAHAWRPLDPPRADGGWPPGMVRAGERVIVGAGTAEVYAYELGP
jgi:hypothetical protein